jgi:hypothetical protein
LNPAAHQRRNYKGTENGWKIELDYQSQSPDLNLLVYLSFGVFGKQLMYSNNADVKQ